MPCPDLAADMTTDGIVQVGGATEGVFGLCNPDESEGSFDTDWYAVQLEYGRTYLFFMDHDGNESGLLPTLDFFDRQAFAETRFDTAGRLFYRYTARYTGTHYVSAFQGTLLNNTQYTINAFEIKDDSRGSGPQIELSNGFAKLDEIEVAGDRDRFLFEVFPDRTYKFIVVADNGSHTLTNPSLELLRNSSTIANGSKFIQFNSTQRETLEVEVGAFAGATGTYSVIGLVQDDAAMGAGTSSQLVFDANGRAVKEGFISEFSDIDWHRVNLEEGDVVRVSLVGKGIDFLETPNLIFRDPSMNVVHVEGVPVPGNVEKLEYYYQAPTSGEHYVVARTKLNSYIGGYEVAVEKVRPPATANELFGRGETARLLMTENTTVPLASLLDLEGLNPFAYHVYSTTPLMRDGNFMAPNKPYGIIAGNIGLWDVDASQINDSGELFLQAKVSDQFTAWQKFAVAPAKSTDGLDSGQRFGGDDPITWKLTASRPDEYGPDEFGVLRGITGNTELGQSLEQIFMQLNRVVEREFVQVAGDEEADMNIMAFTDLGQSYLSYLPAPGRGGDVLFNDSEFTGSLDSVQQLRIRRAVGVALGLNHNASLERQKTVMGGVNVPSGNVPVNFGSDDWLVLQEIYGSDLLNPEDLITDLNNVVIHAKSELMTVGFEARNIIVGDDVADQDFTIDLRDGARSFARSGNGPTAEVIIANGAQVFSGVGGNGNDFISGNGLDNVLQGGDGNDFLIGYEKNDVLLGGRGDDIFIHYFGDGRDFISDEAGIDTLCFIGQGPYEVDRLFEDYVFHRDGNFLEVSLTLDGGGEEGFVRIDTGFNQSNIIESLELWHEGALRQRISLFAIYNELSDGQKSRFTLLDTSDNFGRLAAPV